MHKARLFAKERINLLLLATVVQYTISRPRNIRWHFVNKSLLIYKVEERAQVSTDQCWRTNKKSFLILLILTSSPLLPEIMCWTPRREALNASGLLLEASVTSNYKVARPNLLELLTRLPAKPLDPEHCRQNHLQLLIMFLEKQTNLCNFCWIYDESGKRLSPPNRVLMTWLYNSDL